MAQFMTFAGKAQDKTIRILCWYSLASPENMLPRKKNEEKKYCTWLLDDALVGLDRVESIKKIEIQ